MRKRLYQLLRNTRPHAALTRQYTAELDRNQWLSQAEIEQISWQKLKRLLNHAYTTVPYYQQKFQELGLRPQDIQTPKDFRRLPLLNKDDIRRNEDAFISTKFTKETMTRAVTSGSSGQPFVVYHDLDAEAASVAAFARSRSWFNVEFGDKVAWIWGRRDEISGGFKQQIIHWLKREKWLDGYRPSPERLQQYAAELAAWQPHLIAGYTNVIYLLAQHIKRRNIKGIAPRMIETTGMPLLPYERKLIESVFQCPVSDRYGSHETLSVVAAECPQGKRHIFSDLCYLEILVDGRPAAPGERGEVVATPLHAWGMPLLRFRMEDIAAFDDRACSCGRGLPVLKDIAGRITGIFTLPSGKRLYGGIFRHLALKDTTAIKRFKAHQFSPDKIEITLQPAEGFTPQTIDLIRRRCMEILGNEPVDLEIAVVDEISPTASGKHLVTTSDVPL